MSNINPANTLSFRSTDSLFARIRKRLRSYDSVGIIDEGDWYDYIREVIDKLGVGVYDEKEAIVIVKNSKGPMPEDFNYLYSAYKCSPSMGDSKETVFPQTGFVFYLEETHRPYRRCSNCSAAKINYVEGEKLTIRTVIEGEPNFISFKNPRLLRLGGNVKGICDAKCKNLFTKCIDEIMIDKGFLYANFDDSVYMKYFGLSVDDFGLPMIPDNSFVEKAIEDYIVYRVLEDFWFNAEVPDIEKRYQVARMNYDESMKAALYWVKLPSFQTAIAKIRKDRNNLGIYQQTG